MQTRDYQVCGDYEQMLRDLKANLPGGASFSGNSLHGTVSALFRKKVEFWRNGRALRVVVYEGALVYSEDDIVAMVEKGLSQYLC